MTDPTAAAPRDLDAAPARSRPRAGRRWVIGVTIVVALVAVLAVAAELIARQVVPDRVRAAVLEQLDLPADHPVDVQVDGVLVPQLITGVLDDVRLQSQDVTLGAFSGDVEAHGVGIPIRADAPAAGGTASLRMSTEQLRTLLASIDGFPAETIELAAPNVTAATELELLGIVIPLGITLEPSAAEGQIVLAPVEATVAGATITAEGLRERFGGLVDPLVQDRRLCIADSFPSAMTLQSIEIADDELLASFDIAGGIINEPALQQHGTC